MKYTHEDDIEGSCANVESYRAMKDVFVYEGARTPRDAYLTLKRRLAWILKRLNDNGIEMVVTDEQQEVSTHLSFN